MTEAQTPLIEINKVIIWALIGTWGTVVPALAGGLWWFVKKDRAAVFAKLRGHESKLESLETDISDLNAVVFGHDGDGGVNKWEHRARNLLTPIQGEISILAGKMDKLRLAIARAVPGIDLKDLQ